MLQPIPFTADTLLGSFYKLPDGSILVGGKEATTCGIDPSSGKVKTLKCISVHLLFTHVTYALAHHTVYMYVPIPRLFLHLFQ